MDAKLYRKLYHDMVKDGGIYSKYAAAGMTITDVAEGFIRALSDLDIPIDLQKKIVAAAGPAAMQAIKDRQPQETNND